MAQTVNYAIPPKEDKPVKAVKGKVVKKKKTAKKKTKTIKVAVSKRALTMNDKIRPWYMATFPTDELGARISPNATFMGAWNSLKEKRDIYAYIGVGDSIVRERIFGKIASLKKCSYDFVYNMWLNGTKVKRK